MDDIVEAILVKLQHYTKKKDGDLFYYIDNHLDVWKIDLGDFFLDDIVSQVSFLFTKRARLTQGPADMDIVFREDEATLETKQLATVYTLFDKIHKEAQNLPIATLQEIGTPEEKTVLAKSWEKTLNRIDLLYNKVKQDR